MSEREQNRNLNSNDANSPDYKLLIDPLIRKGEEKLIRFAGETYNTEVRTFALGLFDFGC